MEVAGLVPIDLELESLGQHVCGDLVAGRVDRLLTGGGERPAGDLVLFGEPLGREIVEQPVAGQTEVDGGQRTQCRDLADEVVGDLVDAHRGRR